MARERRPCTAEPPARASGGTADPWHEFKAVARATCLFTLWGNTNNWIEFGAYATGHTSGNDHIETGQFRVRYKASGTLGTPFDWPRDAITGDLVDDIYWSRNSQLLVGLSYNATTHQLTVAASLGGEPLRHAGAATLPTPEFSAALGTLKFQGADDEVVTFRWFGGQAIDGTALPALGTGSMSDQFKSLDFLG